MKANMVAITTSSFDSAGENLVERIKGYGFAVKLNPYGRKMDSEESKAFLTDDIVGIIAGTERLDDNLFAQMPNLKVIIRAGIGMDALDVEAARKYGIVVDNTPNGPVAAVAELTIGVILSLLRRIPEADRNIRQQKWQALMGNLLASKTVGIVGCGRIGRAVATLLKAFECRVMVADPLLSHIEACELGVSLMNFSDLLGYSDIVSLHLSYSPSVHHFISSKEISLMKEGAFLVNVCRGGLVDEKALIEALKKGRIRGAALDTYENEPYTGELCGIENVVLTSHMGSYAAESRAIMERDAVDKLIACMTQQGKFHPFDIP